MNQEPLITVENKITVKQFKTFFKVMLKRQKIIAIFIGVVSLLLGILIYFENGKPFVFFSFGIFMIIYYDLIIAYKCNLFKKTFSDLLDKYLFYEDYFINISKGNGIRKEVEYSYDHINRLRTSSDIIFLITNDSMSHFINLEGLSEGDKIVAISLLRSKIRT